MSPGWLPAPGQLLRFCLHAAALLALAACRPEAPAGGGTLTIFAASSLSDAFDEMGRAFESRHPGTHLVFNFAGSSELALQLLEGAPADVFASANQQQLQRVMEAGRIAGEPADFAANRLVIIVPADNPAGIHTAADLARPGLKLVSAQPGVPIRVFTEEMLEKASAATAYGPGYRAAVLANMASEENNVRQLAAKIVLGEADGGIVYQSDITPELAGRVQRIEIPDAFNVQAVYPVGAIAGGANTGMAEAFVAFVLSQEGQSILAKWGFEAAPDGSTAD